VTARRHVVLAGDSIFDNDCYVPGEPGVLNQLRQSLPAGWTASKVAVDGDVIADVRRQVKNLPRDVTDLIVSVGGNDALRHAWLLGEVRTAQDLLRLMQGPLAEFRAEYAAMLDHLAPFSARLQVCTIYTAIPFAEPLWRTFAPFALDQFNQIILAEAAERGVPVLRLDLACVEARDFSALSPIEPSAQGGQKIVDLIAAALG
jgi:hypothetical protein